MIQIDLRNLMGSKASLEFARVSALAFDPAGERLAVGIGHHVVVVELSDGRQVAEHRVGDGGWVRHLCFTQTGEHLVAEHFDGMMDGSSSLHVVGRDGLCMTLKPERHSEFDGHIRFWAVNPDGSKLAAAMSGANGIWDLRTRKRGGFGAVFSAVKKRSPKLAAGLEPLFDAIEKYQDNMPRNEGPVALTADGDLVAIWMVAPSDPKYVDYGDQLVVANLKDADCRVLPLYDPEWFTTQAARSGTLPQALRSQVFGGTSLLAFGPENTSLVGAVRVSKSDSEYLVSFTRNFTEDKTRILPIPQDRALEPSAISNTTVIWSDAHGGQQNTTVLRQNVATGDHTVGIAPSAEGKASAAAVSPNGGQVARAVDERVIVSPVRGDAGA